MEFFLRRLIICVVFIGGGLCAPLDNVQNSKSISVVVDEKSKDIAVWNDFLVIRTRPRKRQSIKRVTPRPTVKPTDAPKTTTSTPDPTTTTATLKPEISGAVRRTFKFKTTITKVYHVPPKVFVRDWYRFIRNFSWSDFQRRQKNNRCPWCR
ncbi:uncharacterized protein LOC133188801 [Saccostrea echinata]|uniref:uncharacterized protein LOC133188801 n=1 Tax=Saccostrea echinata TaxID=191078 RepID=UPI002A8360C5|nr:uncharacterized protein LOC133188801 [Saccostrea echinata]